MGLEDIYLDEGTIKITVVEANQKIEDAERIVFLCYLKQIAVQYELLSSIEKRDFYGRLKGFVDRSLAYSVKDLSLYSWDSSAKFDAKIACQVRKTLGYTRRDAIIEIGQGLHEMTLYKYEKGILKVHPERISSWSYLLWLQDKHYDPFKIKKKSEITLEQEVKSNSQ